MTEEEPEDGFIWEPVSSGGNGNDYPLAFGNVDQDEDKLTFNIDGDDHEPEDTEGPVVQGTYKGLVDISSEDNPKPSMKHLVESDDDERTYAFNNVKALESQFEDVEEGSIVGVDFDGYEEPEDGLPWQNWTVYTPGQ